MTPRGIRNKNPGNLVITTIPWKGKVPREENTDGKFEQFYEMVYGIRAMMLDVRTDIRKGKNTIRKLITEYAPKFENNTEAYINSVSKRTGIAPDTKMFPDKSTLTKLIDAISAHENGGSFITMNEIVKAFELI